LAENGGFADWSGDWFANERARRDDESRQPEALE